MVALKILLIDPDNDWREVTAVYFKENQYLVDSVSNGRDAQAALYKNKYFAIFLNLETENHSGRQVLSFIKANHSGQNVVVILESNKAMDKAGLTVVQLKKMGATEVMIKPFEDDEMKVILEGHQTLKELVSSLPKRKGVSDEVDVTCDDDNFSKVCIDEFFSSQAVLFDVFIRLKENHYVKILHAGDQFSKDRIDRYKNEKGITHLYFKSSDRRKYINYYNHLSQKLNSKTEISASGKINLLRNVSEKYVAEVFTIGLKPQVIEQGKEVCENIYKMIENQGDLFQVLRTYQDFDPDAFTHAYLVTLFSGSIIKQFEWQSKIIIETTAMAGMFHDIGKMRLPKEMLEMRPEDMDEKMLGQYKMHPILGLELVKDNVLINNSIKQIILQHHEAYDGTGFPNGLKRQKILMLANIVCLADDFVHIITKEKLKPVDGLKRILTNKSLVTRYNSTILEKFIKVFVDPGLKSKDHALPSNSRIVPAGKKAS